jgi:NADPH:quinone reductase-like Zn-dependent oxidoreductase
MKAAVFEALGRVPVYADFPEPQARDDAVVATVEAAALTNLTRGLVAGKHYGSSSLRLPGVAGMDGVVRLADGRRVYGTAVAPYGMMAERTLIAPGSTVELPDGMDSVLAAAAPNPGVSAWVSLQHAARIHPGQHVLVLGSTGVTGSLAVQLAKTEFGIERVVAVGRDADRLEWLRGVGADTIRLGHDDLTARVAAAHAERPFDAVIDYLWGEPAEQVLAALGNRGLGADAHATQFIQVGTMAGETANLAGAILRSAAVTLRGVGFGSVPIQVLLQANREFLPRLFTMLARGQVQLATQRQPLADVEEVWSQREPSGTRVVFTP